MTGNYNVYKTIWKNENNNKYNKKYILCFFWYEIVKTQ